MLAFGIAGRLKTLVDRLTSTRATNLDNLDTTVSGVNTNIATSKTVIDTLASRLTSNRAGYLDKLNVTGNVASATDVTNATAVVAQNSDPLLAPPIAANFPPIGALNNFSGTMDELANSIGGVKVSTTNTSWTDAVSITGKGVLKMLVTKPSTGSAGADFGISLVVDGVTLVSQEGIASPQKLVVGGMFIDPSGLISAMTFDAIPFRSSLLIRHKARSGNYIETVYKLHRTA